MGRGREEGQLQASSPGPAADPERKLQQIRCRSQSQPAHAHDAQTQAARKTSPLPGTQNASHTISWPSLTPPTWDDILAQIYDPAAYLPSHVPLHILAHLLSPRVVPVGWRLTITWCMPHNIVMQTRAHRAHRLWEWPQLSYPSNLCESTTLRS